VIQHTDATQVFSLTQILVLAYQSTGVIYGDIGTSPLYVYSSTFTEAPSRINLLGALSLILWSVTLMVTVKYVLIILRADNDGEGGTFSTYSLLSKYVRQTTCVSTSVTDVCRQTSRTEIHAKQPSYVSVHHAIGLLILTSCRDGETQYRYSGPIHKKHPLNYRKVQVLSRSTAGHRCTSRIDGHG